MDHPPETAYSLHHFGARVKVLYQPPEIPLLGLVRHHRRGRRLRQVHRWGERHIDFLSRFLPYKDGIPSHDALNNLMDALNPVLVCECFVGWVNRLRDATRILSRLMARPPAAQTPSPRDGSSRIWCPPGRHPSASSAVKKPPISNPTRSPPFRCCSSDAN
jgi:hypothetical protein